MPAKRILPVTLAALATLGMGSAAAGPIDTRHWRVEAGDTLFGIARRLAPGDRDRQRALRRWILEHNPAVFGGNPNHLPLGATLALPSAPAAQRERVATPLSPTPRPVAAATVKPAPAAGNTARSTTPTTVPVAAPARPAEREEAPPIGRIIIAAGTVGIESPTGIERSDRRLHEGDTLETGPDSTAQIRLSDGSLMTLRPNTRLRIARYHFDRTAPQQDATTLELIKGGLRTLTGIIGKRNRDRYQVRTSVATIGIRGTHYGLRLCGPDDCPGHAPGLYGAVADGAIVVRNGQGEFRFGNDEYFHLASANARPRGLIRPPGVIFDADRGLKRAQRALKAAAARQDRAELIRRLARRGHPEALAIARLLPLARPGLIKADQSQANNLAMKRAPFGAATVVAFNDTRFGVGSDSAAVRDNGTPDQVILLGRRGPVKNLPVMLRATDPLSNSVYGFAAGQATLADIGGHPMGVNWGRWNGPFVVAENGNPAPHAGNFHFAYSPNIATLQQLGQLGPLLGQVTYTTPTFGSPGTRPTDHLGNAGTVNLATMDVDFGAQQITNYYIDVTVNGNNYDGALQQPVSLPQAVVDGMPLANISTSGTCATAGGCTGVASVSFVNDYTQNRPAAGAISSYSINTIDGSSGVSGVVFMTRP